MPRYLITGASKGIGRATARRLANKSIDLILHGRDETALDAVRIDCEGRGASVATVAADLSTVDGAQAVIDAIGSQSLDLLCNNAGYAVAKSLDEITVDDWNRQFAVNVTAPFLLIKALAPAMPAGSMIVNMLSVAAKNGFPNWSAYCMSKFALEGFSQSIRHELRERGIKILTIYPAATDTEIWETSVGRPGPEQMLPPEEVAEQIAFALARPNDVMVQFGPISHLMGYL